MDSLKQVRPIRQTLDPSNGTGVAGAIRRSKLVARDASHNLVRRVEAKRLEIVESLVYLFRTKCKGLGLRRLWLPNA